MCTKNHMATLTMTSLRICTFTNFTKHDAFSLLLQKHDSEASFVLFFTSRLNLRTMKGR